MNSAADIVFNCTELLELILSFLPMADLLLAAQQTCQQWRAVVLGSTKLQRCLFFVPDWRGVDVYGLNPLLVQRFRFRRDQNGWLHIKEPGEWRDRLLSCRTASWRRMLIAQPPEAFTMEVMNRGAWKRCGFSDDHQCGKAWSILRKMARSDSATRPRGEVDSD
ncbi:hypothetical protein GTA08_BOTSDO06092 [Neofusicoccum parvum]|nr:hypothetical protein GTA08_BOTSDO06092 [Neofusicoccum parvum]